ncbi:MAG: recR [Candidatus Adlerbacteria bacterium]|nr:recR [Candidatus Adlerbacteria bacterium]
MDPIQRLTEVFERFPGIGPRQARRFVQFLLSQRAGYRNDLALAIRELGAHTQQCNACFRWFVKDSQANIFCNICSNEGRDAHVLFVVEKDADIENVERSGFRGKYFVLGGTIPLATEEPEKFVRMRELVARIDADASLGKLKEVILGLSATAEGDHTRVMIAEKLRAPAEAFSLKITALGRGLSTGSELEYADPDTIASALSSRQ